MMMFDMHPDTAKHFYKEACPTGREMTKKTGIAELVPGAVVDDFAFDPCGCDILNYQYKITKLPCNLAVRVAHVVSWGGYLGSSAECSGVRACVVY